MIKFLQPMVLVSLFAVEVDAQDKTWYRKNVNLRVGPEIAFAVGDLNRTQATGVGGSALLDLPVHPRWSVIFYAGAISIAGDKISGQQGNKYTRTNIYPVRTGINYKLTDNFYGAVQLGQATVKYLDDTESRLSQSLGLGYFNGKIDAGLRWDHNYAHGGLGSLNAKFAYVLNFSRRR